MEALTAFVCVEGRCAIAVEHRRNVTRVIEKMCVVFFISASNELAITGWILNDPSSPSTPTAPAVQDRPVALVHSCSLANPLCFHQDVSLSHRNKVL